MTQPTGTELFATTDEVAALIGVMPNTLPNGVATIEQCPMEYSSVDSAYHQLRTFKTTGTAYTWRDAAGCVIADIRIPAQSSELLYQRNDYDETGIKKTAHEQFKNGKVNKFSFHENGQVRHGAYGTAYGYDSATQHRYFDEEGKLHNPAGHAIYIRAKYKHEEAYYLHGTRYQKPEFDQHPARVSYLNENRIDKVIASAIGRAFNAVARVIADVPDAPREGVLKTDQLIAIAENLSEADKLRLLRAITHNVEEASDDKTLAKAVEGAGVRITAPSVKGITRRTTR